MSKRLLNYVVVTQLTPDLWPLIANGLNFIDSVNFSMVCKEFYNRHKVHATLAYIEKVHHTMRSDDYDYEHRCGDKRCLYKTIIKRMVGVHTLYNYDRRYVLRHAKIVSAKRDQIMVDTSGNGLVRFKIVNVFALQLNNNSYIYIEFGVPLPPRIYHKTNDMALPELLLTAFIQYFKDSHFLLDSQF